MSTVVPRHVLCILGKWKKFDEIEAVVRRIGEGKFELDREYSQLKPDSRMVKAFDTSFDRVTPTATESDRQAIRDHSAVAYVLSPPLKQKQANDLSAKTLALTAALFEAGGTAAKDDSAGIAHGKAEWLKKAAEFSRAVKRSDSFTQGATLYRAWVRRPLHDMGKHVYYSCGMHLLGERDVEIEDGLEIDEALKWIDLFGLYRVADRPERPINDGEGFRLSEEGPRRIIRLGPCDRYAGDDYFHNPYGYVRLEKPS